MYPESRPHAIREFPDFLARPTTPDDQETYNILIPLTQRYQLRIEDILRYYLATPEFTPILLQATLDEKGIPLQLADTAIRVAISHMVICFGLYQLHHFYIPHSSITPDNFHSSFARQPNTPPEFYLSQIGEFAAVIIQIQEVLHRQTSSSINL